MADDTTEPVGATLLYDSVPAMEEQETRLKATAFFRAIQAGAARQTLPLAQIGPALLQRLRFSPSSRT